jgi:hypothetical protein
LNVPAAAVVDDFSDLDLRDANNRPVTAPAAVRQLRLLFVRSLNDALLNNLTPARSAVLKTLNAIAARSPFFLRAALAMVFHHVRSMISERKLKHPARARATEIRAPRSVSARSPRAAGEASGRMCLSLLSSVVLLR